MDLAEHGEDDVRLARVPLRRLALRLRRLRVAGLLRRLHEGRRLARVERAQDARRLVEDLGGEVAVLGGAFELGLLVLAEVAGLGLRLVHLGDRRVDVVRRERQLLDQRVALLDRRRRARLLLRLGRVRALVRLHLRLAPPLLVLLILLLLLQDLDEVGDDLLDAGEVVLRLALGLRLLEAHELLVEARERRAHAGHGLDLEEGDRRRRGRVRALAEADGEEAHRLADRRLLLLAVHLALAPLLVAVLAVLGEVLVARAPGLERLGGAREVVLRVNLLLVGLGDEGVLGADVALDDLELRRLAAVELVVHARLLRLDVVRLLLIPLEVLLERLEDAEDEARLARRGDLEALGLLRLHEARHLRALDDGDGVPELRDRLLVHGPVALVLLLLLLADRRGLGERVLDLGDVLLVALERERVPRDRRVVLVDRDLEVLDAEPVVVDLRRLLGNLLLAPLLIAGVVLLLRLLLVVDALEEVPKGIDDGLDALVGAVADPALWGRAAGVRCGLRR